MGIARIKEAQPDVATLLTDEEFEVAVDKVMAHIPAIVEKLLRFSIRLKTFTMQKGACFLPPLNCTF